MHAELRRLDWRISNDLGLERDEPGGRTRQPTKWTGRWSSPQHSLQNRHAQTHSCHEVWSQVH